MPSPKSVTKDRLQKVLSSKAVYSCYVEEETKSGSYLCNYCKKPVKTSGGSVTNLKRHLVTVHADALITDINKGKIKVQGSLYSESTTPDFFKLKTDASDKQTGPDVAQTATQSQAEKRPQESREAMEVEGNPAVKKTKSNSSYKPDPTGDKCINAVLTQTRQLTILESVHEAKKLASTADGRVGRLRNSLTKLFCKAGVPLSTLSPHLVEEFIRTNFPMCSKSSITLPSQMMNILSEQVSYALTKMVDSQIETNKWTFDLQIMEHGVQKYVYGVFAYTYDIAEETMISPCIASGTFRCKQTPSLVADLIKNQVLKTPFDLKNVVATLNQSNVFVDKVVPLLFHKQPPRIQCLDTALLKIAQELFESRPLFRAKQKIQEIRSFVFHNDEAKDLFLEQAAILAPDKDPESLDQDLTSALNLRTFLDFEEVLMKVLSSQELQQAPPIGTADFKVVKEYLGLLKWLTERTDTIDSSGVYLASEMYPHLYYISEKVAQTDVFQPDALSLKTILQSSLETLVNSMQNEWFNLKTTVLDPRYKTVIPSFPEMYAKVRRSLLEDIQKTADEYGVEFTSPAGDAKKPVFEPQSEVLKFLHSKGKNLLSSYSKNEITQRRFDTFIHDPDEYEESLDPLKFWNGRLSAEPALARHALNIVSVPGKRLLKLKSIAHSQNLLKVRKEELQELLFMASLGDGYWNI